MWRSSYSFTAYPSFVLANKLKALKDFRQWNKDVFGDVKYQKQCRMEELLDLDVKEGMGGLTFEELRL